jgi:outer membrane receptor protein involved in Fe transport
MHIGAERGGSTEPPLFLRCNPAGAPLNFSCVQFYTVHKMNTGHPASNAAPRSILFSVFLIFVVALFVGPLDSAYGQGKIAGRVTEKATGDALIGVNVVIDGTTQGTVTDTNGNYVIVNVRPGDYTLAFSYIGFAREVVSGIRVSTGQTTRYNISLREQVVEGEEIIVRAERPLVSKDLTASRKSVIAAEIEALPVEDFFGVLVTQAGVSQGPSGEIHIRGGRSNEIAYLVDGMSVGNPFDTNGLATTVATGAIQEMTVISGAFNAEYGRAMSGIVNLVTKEGSDRMKGSFSYYGGDNFTSNKDLYGTPDNVNINVYTMEATLSGAVPLARKIKFFISGRLDDSKGNIYGWREHLPSDSANFNGDPALLETIRSFRPGYNGPSWYYELQGKPWYEYGENEQIPSERVAMNPRSSGNFVAKLSTRPFKGTKLEYSLLMDGAKRKRFNFAYRYNPDGVLTTRDNSLNQGLYWTHTINDRTFYTIKMSVASNVSRSRLYSDPTDPRYVSTGAIVGFPGNQFLFGGNQKGNVSERSRSFRLKGDLTKQFGAVHEAKVGVDMQLHRLSRENFVILYDNDIYREPEVPGIDTPAHNKYKNQKVSEISAFVQDKLEFDDFIVNAGIRYERFDPNGFYIPDLLNPIVSQDGLARAQPTNLIMPRIGVSFPITARGIIHFSYGHFAQMPSLRNLYRNPEFEFGVGSQPTFGNTNMRPERTITYEMGLQQQITDDLAFDITGFFKDIRDYLARETIRFSTISGEDVYNIFLNKDYANVKGMTFSLTKRRSRNGYLSATLDYTLQVAEGNNTDANSFFFNLLSGKENELELVPLGFDQRHILSSTVTLSDPGSWGISFIGQYSSGYPYTPLLFDQKIDQIPNQERKPSQLNLDMQAHKTFRLKGNSRLRVFTRVFNLLDRLNERFVFSDTGRATYSLNGERGIHASWEPAYGLPGIRDLNEYNKRPNFYNSPREIKIGATLSF